MRPAAANVRGEDDEKSDLDLLVDATDKASLFDLAGLELELPELLGVRVGVLTPGGIGPRLADSVYRDARPL